MTVPIFLPGRIDSSDYGGNQGDYQIGQVIGDFGSLITGSAEIVGGPAISGSGVFITVGTGGTAALVLVPSAIAGAAVTTHGISVAGVSAYNLSQSLIDRNAFRKVRENYWKDEAKNNLGNYSPEDLKRMNEGKAPIGPDGKPMELHHKDGTPNGGVEPMTQQDHRGGENYQKNHPWVKSKNK